MSAPSQTLDILQRERQSGPAYYSGISDEMLYKILEKRGAIPSSAMWEDQSTTKKTPDTTNTSDVDDLSFLGSMADWGINENSYDWMKAAYNRSLTGVTEQLIYGDARYDVDESDFSLLEDIGATIVSFFMPLDILTMGVGSRIGAAAGRTALKSGLFGGAMKKASQEAVEAGAKDILQDRAVTEILSNSKLQKALLGGIQQMPALGLYEAAVTGVHSKLNGESFIGGAAEGAFHGSIMGFFTGAIGGGMGAKQAEILSKGAKKDQFLSKMDKVRAYGVYGMPGQIGAEAGFFSAADLGMRAIKGEDIRGEDVLHSFAHNVGLFTGLKTIGKIQNKFWKETDAVWKELKNETSTKDKTELAIDRANASYKETIGKESEALAREKSKMTEQDIVDRAVNESVGRNIEKILEIKRSGDPSKIDGLEVARINYTLSEIISRLEKDPSLTPAKEQILKDAKKEKEALEREFKDWLDSSKKEEIAPEQVKDIDAEREGLQVVAEDVKAPKKAPEKDKALEKMSDAELVQEGARVLNKKAEEVQKDYESAIINPNTNKKGIQKDKLIEAIQAKKKEKFDMELGPELDSPQEHWRKKSEDKDLPQKDDVMNKVGQITEKLVDEGITPKDYNNLKDPKLKESYYDIHDIGQNKFASETRTGKDKDAKGQKKLVNTGQDIRYIDHYIKFAKELAKEGKSLRDATKKDVISFINKNKGAENSLKILYDSMLPSGKLRDGTLISFVPEIQKYKGLAPRVDKGLRIDRVDLEKGEVKYVQSKTLGEKEVPLGTRLKNLFKKILGKVKTDDVAGDTIFRDVKGKALTKTQQQNIVKRYFGDLVSNSDLRKAFSQYIANKYKINSWQWDLINQMGLGHKVEKITGAYTKGAGKMKSDLVELQREFIEFIEGKEILKQPFAETYKKGQGVNIQTLRDAYNKIKTDRAQSQTGEVEIGRSTIKLDTAEALIRYMVETSPRPGETVPPKGKDVIFKAYVPKFAQKTDYQLKALRERLDADIVEQRQYKDYFEKIPEYKNLKIKLGQELGSVNGKKVLGQIEGHIVSIAKGNVKADTIPHEVSHYVVNVLKQFGTKKSKSLIERGINMFGAKLKRKDYSSESKFLKAKEELFVERIGEYAQGMIKEKGLISKAKSWVRAFNAQVKEFFGLANKEDVAFIMSRKVIKGNVPINAKVKNYIDKASKEYQFAAEAPKDANMLYAFIKKIEKDLRSSRELNQAEINELRRKFDINLEGANKGVSGIGELNAYGEYLYDRRGRAKDYSSRLEELTIENNITIAESEKIARALGSIDGKIKNLTSKNKVFYEEIIKEMSKKEQVTPTATDHIDGLKGNLTYHQRLARLILPAYEFIGKYGGAAGKAIRDKIVYFDTFNTRLRGFGYDGTRIIKEKLGKDRFKTFVKNASLFDTQRIENYIKAFEKDGIGVKEGWKKLSDAEITFYKNSKKEGTVEYEAKKVWENVRKYYWEKFKRETRKVNNEAEYERFEKDFNDKFVNDYFTRRLSKDAYKHLIENGNIDKIVKTNLDRAAKIKARKKLGKNASQEKVNELAEKLKKDTNLETEVYKDIYHYFKQDHREIKNSFLMERGPILPEFMIIKSEKTGQNKLVRTYEQSYEGTIDAYIAGMSKHIATVRHFPDYSGMGGKYKTGKTPADLARLAGKDRFLKDYAERTIETLVGVGERSPLHKEGHSFLSSVAHISAFTGLSSPTSGIKNLLIGIPRSIASFGFINTAKGFGKLFNTNTWNEARAKGILEYGAKTLELGKKRRILGKNMEDVFKWNLMTKTENVNRIISMEAGKLYFSAQVQALNGKGLMGKMGYKNAMRLMKDMWQLSEKDIKFLHKMDRTKADHASRFNEILAHIEQTSHISAQGGTSVGRLPGWMSSKYGKPLTLFQRMAYSTTYDSVKNYYQPALKGNFAPLARALIAHGVSGFALYAMYETLFDTEPPQSADKGLDKMTMYLWRSEFLGLAGALISPYEGENRGMFASLTQPVIARNLMEGKKQFTRWYYGKEFAGKALDNWAKSGIVLYNQWDTMRKVSTSKEYSNARKLQNWENQFKKTLNIDDASKDLWGKRSPYYRNLKESLYSGDEKEMAKKVYAAYNYIISDLEDKYAKAGIYRDWSMNHKDAIYALNTSLKSMEPGNIFSETTKGQSLSMKGAFKKWIKENFGNEGSYSFRQSQKHYHEMMKKLRKVFNENWELYSAYGGSKNKGAKL